MASSASLTTTHLPQLRTILDKWNQTRPPSTGFPDAHLAESSSKEVIVTFRTRPPLPNEATDKFQAHSLDALQPEGMFIAHVPGMKWSGPTLVHKRSEADLGFGPDIHNEEVYQRTVIAHNVLSLALSGGRRFHLRGRTADIPAAVFEISLPFLEPMGNRASDLLKTPKTFDTQGNSVRTAVHIREDNDRRGNVQPRLISTPVASSAELEALIKTALSHRRTAATLRNAASSRSHAILTITTKNTLFPYANEGKLILMDLAGSERFEDSKDHDKQRMDEVRENNKGLMNLKECVRAKAKMASEDGFVHIPWRAHKLTRRPIFDVESRQPSMAVVTAHVSPHIQHSVHSANTLSYGAPFMTVPPKPRGPAPGPPPLSLFRSRLGVDLSAVCPPGATAAHLGRLYTTDFVVRCLAARTGAALSEARLTAVALDAVRTLFSMLMVAKNRTRRAVIESWTKVTDTSLHTPEATARRAAQVAAAKAESEGTGAFVSP
ncbi:P-loop containing nucleoside triphosphate hydrolase protein [Mycena vitilis]|nr:P-loop containing nucleoside triphosphate hydrolase protein [Mycena vitilis]